MVFILEFRQIGLEDKDWLSEILRAADLKSADYSFTNIFVWNLTFKQLIARQGKWLILMPTFRHEPYFNLPLGGEGELSEPLELMRLYAEDKGFPLMLRSVTDGQLELIEKQFPGKFKITHDTAFAEYVYSIDKLCSLSGKKLSAKRNHINRFIANNEDWQFEDMDSSHLEECRQMLELWYAQAGPSTSFDREHEAILRALEYFDRLEIEGGVLRAGGRIIAFTMGSVLTHDTYGLTFEKAFSEIQGAYAMINREFARSVAARHPNIAYVNREDDMGLENIKKAKLSYYPDFMVRKHSARWLSP